MKKIWTIYISLILIYTCIYMHITKMISNWIFNFTLLEYFFFSKFKNTVIVINGLPGGSDSICLQFRRTGFDLWEKGMATYSSILAWRIPWTEEPGGLQSMGLQRIRHNWVIITFTSPFIVINTFTKCKNTCDKFQK